MENKSIKVALAESTAELMSLSGVLGTAEGLCDGKPCIVVYVDEEKDELRKEIPEKIEGYPVRLKVSGKFRALGPEEK